MSEKSMRFLRDHSGTSIAEVRQRQRRRSRPQETNVVTHQPQPIVKEDNMPEFKSGFFTGGEACNGRVLVVDDEPDIRKGSLAKALGGHLEMLLAVRGGGGRCAQSCAGFSFAWMFFVEIHLGAIS